MPIALPKEGRNRDYGSIIGVFSNHTPLFDSAVINDIKIELNLM